jgi:hypothetical protein
VKQAYQELFRLRFGGLAVLELVLSELKLQSVGDAADLTFYGHFADGSRLI